MFENFNFEITSLFKKSEHEMQELKHPYVGSEHLLLAMLSSKNAVSKVLNNFGLTYKRFKEELINVVGIGYKSNELKLYTPLLKRVIENALNDAKEDNNAQVTVTHLMLALLEEAEGIAIRIMLSLNIDLDALYKSLHKPLKNHNLTIYEIGTNLNETVNLNEVVIGRNKEINILIETLLRKNKNNPLLIGKAGTGKSAIVEEFVKRVQKKQVPQELLNKKIVMLDMASLVAGTKYRGEFEDRLNKIITEILSNKDIILFIDEIHTLVNAGGAEGAIDASNILKPYLARGELKIIGATTTEEYHKYIAKDKALARRFETIFVKEPNEEQTLEILMHVKTSYESHHNLKITNKNIIDICTLSNKYIYDKNNPDKCLDVLDSVCAKVKCKKNNQEKLQSLELELQKNIQEKEDKIIKQNFKEALMYKEKEKSILTKIHNLQKLKKSKITYEDILEVIENKTNIPLLENLDQKYLKLEKELNRKIIGQKQGINQILQTLKNYWQEEFDKPLSLLITGPTGVGKTYTAKTMATALNMTLLRLDMSEYNLEISINKLIGSSAGYIGYNDECIFKQLLQTPYSLILVDEVEKAHPKVLNLFLQILDEGYLTLASNEKINFKNALIIITSNLKIYQSVGFTQNISDHNILPKELLNRVDKIINYEQIDKSAASTYLTSNFKDINVDEVLKVANYQKYGFRDLNRCIKNIKNKQIKN